MRRNRWRERDQAIFAGRRSALRSARQSLRRAGCTCGGNLSDMSDAELMHAAATDGKTVEHRAGCRLL